MTLSRVGWVAAAVAFVTQLYALFYATQVSLEFENAGVFEWACLLAWVPGVEIMDLLFPVHGVCTYRPSRFALVIMLALNTTLWGASSGLVLLGVQTASRWLPLRRNI